MFVRRVVAIAAASVLAAAVGSLGSLPSAAATTSVDVQDFQFVAPAVTVTAGDAVQWTVSGQASHSVTADDGSFDSSPSCPSTCLSHGSVFTHTFTVPGVYRYYCRIHGAPGGVGMSGTITVVAAETTTTTAPARTTTTTTSGPPGAAVGPVAAAAPTSPVPAAATLTG